MSKKNKLSKSSKKADGDSGNIEFSVFHWSQSLGMDRATLTKRLRIADIQFKPHGKVSAVNIFRALAGDDKQARARRENAQAEMIESKLQERRGSLIAKELVQTSVRNVCLPVRQRLNCLASECAHLCNPADPAHAMAVLAEWVKRSLPVIREEKEKLDAKTKTVS